MHTHEVVSTRLIKGRTRLVRFVVDFLVQIVVQQIHNKSN